MSIFEADEQLLDDPEGLTEVTSARNGLYVYRAQDGHTSLLNRGRLSPAAYPLPPVRVCTSSRTPVNPRDLVEEAREEGSFYDGVSPLNVQPYGEPETVYHSFGTGVADLTFPRKIHDELISDGRAKPHGAGFANVVSYHIREPEDVSRVLELFRMSYKRAKESAERRRERTERSRYSHDEQRQRSA